MAEQVVLAKDIEFFLLLSYLAIVIGKAAAYLLGGKGAHERVAAEVRSVIELIGQGRRALSNDLVSVGNLVDDFFYVQFLLAGGKVIGLQRGRHGYLPLPGLALGQ